MCVCAFFCAMLFVCFAFFCVFIAVAYIVERSECVHVTFKPYNRELPYASIENRPHTANDVMHLVVCSARDSLCYSSSFFFSCVSCILSFAYIYINLYVSYFLICRAKWLRNMSAMCVSSVS